MSYPLGPLEESGLGPNVQKEIRANLARATAKLKEHHRAAIEARAIAKKAKQERVRSRMRSLLRNPNAMKKYTDVTGRNRMAGDSDFSLMARMSGLSVKQLAAVMGLTPLTIYRWHGVPIFRWPTAFMRLYLWAKKMETALIERGVDTEAMKPVLDQPYLQDGRYPRKDPA